MRSISALALAGLLTAGVPVFAADAPPRTSRAAGKAPTAPGPVLTPGPVVTPADPWADAMAAFASADTTRDAKAGGVVFVGSSSIRLWTDLEKRYRSYAAINRGFGGSTLADCVKHMDRLVLPHKPRLVVIYAGDNDLAGGRSAEAVLLDFVELTSRIQERLPTTQIVFVSIKPSPARVDLLDRIREANTRIRNYIATKPYLQYIDVFTPMLDSKGRPRGELFGSDLLHLNEEGYALWHSLISPVLPMDEQPSVLRDSANPGAVPTADAAATELAKAPAAARAKKLEMSTVEMLDPDEPWAPAPRSTPKPPSSSELAKAPASPPTVKTAVLPAAPVPAPPPLVEEPEPDQPPAPPAMAPTPAPEANEAAEGTRPPVDAASGGSSPGGTGAAAAAQGAANEARAGRPD